MDEFRYLGSSRRLDQESENRGSICTPAEAKLVCCGEQRAEPEGRVSVCPLIHVANITYDYVIWVVTECTSSQIQAT